MQIWHADESGIKTIIDSKYVFDQNTLLPYDSLTETGKEERMRTTSPCTKSDIITQKAQILHPFPFGDVCSSAPTPVLYRFFLPSSWLNGILKLFHFLSDSTQWYGFHLSGINTLQYRQPNFFTQNWERLCFDMYYYMPNKDNFISNNSACFLFVHNFC